MKTLIQANNALFNSFRKNSGNIELKHLLESLQECLNTSIEFSKQSITSE